MMTSGGLALAYRTVVAAFERESSLAVEILPGAPQSSGPKAVHRQPGS